MLGSRFRCRRDCQQFALARAGGRDLAQRRTAFSEGACLVEHDLRHQAVTLERLAGAHQDSALRRFASAADDGQRCGDAHRARVSHDEHAQSRKHGALEINVPGDEVGDERPAQYGQQCDRKHHRRVDAQNPVDEVQDAGLECSRILDFTRDALQEGLFADGGDPHEQGAHAVDGSADHRVARAALDRDRFAGHERQING